MTSFHTEKDCRLANKKRLPAPLCCSAHQLLIYSTFVLVFQLTSCLSRRGDSLHLSNISLHRL